MATFVSVNSKTKVIVRKQGYPTHCKTFLKKSDGIIWARKVESEMERGLFEDTAKAKTILFSTVLDKYYASCVARNLKALRFIKAHSNIIKDSLAQLRLIDIDSQRLASYRDQRLTSVSPATTKLELGIIIRALKFAVHEMGIYLPSFPQVKYPTVSNARHRRASSTEINTIKENISNPEIRIIIDLAIHTAMRRGEMLNIQWQHINWSKLTLLIPETKTGQPRKVPLTAKAVTSLRQLEIKDLGLVFSVKADSVCADKGVELMQVDGRITAKVINHFTKKNIPVLTIHDSYITPHTHTGELRRVMNEAVTEELNGFKINIDQEGVGLDQIQAFRNMDRANASDHNYNQIVSYNRTEGYNNRLKQHKGWLLKVNN